ncbi:MAG: glycosyltransferase family 4 protein [Planctomycetota bacterium]
MTLAADAPTATSTIDRRYPPIAPSAGFAHAGKSVLFLTPNFVMDRRKKSLRGVEVFDIQLVRHLVQLGVRVTVIADATWRERFDEHFDGARPDVVFTPSLRKPVPNSIVGALIASPRETKAFDVAVLGNVARGCLPGAELARLRGIADRFLMIAHRWPSAKTVAWVNKRACDVVSVSGYVNDAFDLHGVEPSVRRAVCYGLPNADLFFPPDPPALNLEDPPEATPDTPVNFCLLGSMESANKGVPETLAVWNTLPAEVRRISRLHLASYREPPARSELPDDVIAHPWMASSDVPPFLRTMTCVIVNSKWETFCQAMVQGMLTRMPTIVNTQECLVEKLDEGGGIVFDNDEQLRDAITRVATDPAWRVEAGRIARRVALERYVWSSERFVNEHLFADADVWDRSARSRTAS